MRFPGGWEGALRGEREASYWPALMEFVAAERATHAVFPPAPLTFRALQLTAPQHVRVVILGQDPYHGAGQAHGLAFSVPVGVPAPPSLRNILRELRDDLGIAPPAHGCLEAWAHQGVLLLNTVLTVRASQAGSHRGRGWERLTDRIITVVGNGGAPVVFLLWGAAASAKRALIDGGGHAVFESPHPSPLSAHRGFFGSRPFSQTNAALRRDGRGEIDWRLPPAPF